MSAILPSKKSERLQWLLNRMTKWSTNATLIGLTSGEVTDLQMSLEGAIAAENNIAQAKIALKNEQNYFDISYNETSTLAAAAIKKIKNKAVINPTIYSLADIPAPPSPTPSPAPTAATAITATALVSGEVRLDWQGTVANGIFYKVYRQLDGQTSFRLLESVGAKTYLDSTVPVGSTGATYYLITARGQSLSAQSERVSVRLGYQAPVVGRKTKLKLAA